MILRRIAEAFRRQDWFTVFIETMIVVLGVFIGLQVQEWSGRREDRARESLRIAARDAKQHPEFAKSHAAGAAWQWVKGSLAEKEAREVLTH